MAAATRMTLYSHISQGKMLMAISFLEKSQCGAVSLQQPSSGQFFLSFIAATISLLVGK